MGFTHNVIIFDKIQCVCVIWYKNKWNPFDCSYYETYAHNNFSGILHPCKNDRVVHYFEYADLRLDGMENNLQKQKD